MKTVSRLATLLAVLALAAPASAGDAKMPEKMKANGFVAEYPAGLEKAKKEGKLVLLYVTPGYFT